MPAHALLTSNATYPPGCSRLDGQLPSWWRVAAVPDTLRAPSACGGFGKSRFQSRLSGKPCYHILTKSLELNVFGEEDPIAEPVSVSVKVTGWLLQEMVSAVFCIVWHLSRHLPLFVSASVPGNSRRTSFVWLFGGSVWHLVFYLAQLGLCVKAATPDSPSL